MQRKENQSFNSDLSQKDTNELFPNSPIEKEYCEIFQQKLDAQYINTIWVRFSEKSGTRDTKDRDAKDNKLLSQNFFTSELQSQLLEDKILGQEPELAKKLVDALFRRFKIEDGESIDIQDLMIAFTILSRMKEDQKLKEIFKLTDIDGDDCLSIEDIHQMIRRIERVFCKEIVHIKNDSALLLNELALIQAERKFNLTIHGMGKESQLEGTQQDEDKFISWAEFYESLESKPWLKESFLPNNFQITAILQNVSEEPQLKISDIDDFNEFRKILHLQLRKHYTQKDYRTFITLDHKGIPLPGQVTNQILKIKKDDIKHSMQQGNQNTKKLNKDKDYRIPPDFEKCNPVKDWKGFDCLQKSLNEKKQKICQKQSDIILLNMEQDKKKEAQHNDKLDGNKLNNYKQVVREMQEQSQKYPNQPQDSIKVEKYK